MVQPKKPQQHAEFDDDSSVAIGNMDVQDLIQKASEIDVAKDRAYLRNNPDVFVYYREPSRREIAAFGLLPGEILQVIRELDHEPVYLALQPMRDDNVEGFMGGGHNN